MATGGPRHRVIYDYQATDSNELNIRAGQIVYVTEEMDKGWVRGYTADRTQSGLFPAAYVEPDPSSEPTVPPPSSTSTMNTNTAVEVAAASAEIGLVIEDFTSQDAAHLSLSKDQLVVILRKFVTDWASGECNGKMGMFPLKHVRILDKNEAAALRAATSLPTVTSAAATKKAGNKEKRMSRIRSSTLSSMTKVRHYL